MSSDMDLDYMSVHLIVSLDVVISSTSEAYYIFMKKSLGVELVDS